MSEISSEPGTNSSHPAPAAIKDSPTQDWMPTLGRSKTRLITFATRGEIRNRVVICAALIRLISQSSSTSATQSGIAHASKGTRLDAG